MNTSKIQDLDASLVKASKKIKVLNSLSWPVEAEDIFLKGWHAGKPKLPDIQLKRPDVANNVAELESIAKQCQADDPVEKFLLETAQSYAFAGRMLMAIGTPEFTTYSTRIYGRPDMIYKYQGMTAVDAAKYFLEVTDNLLGNQHIEPTALDISAAEFSGWLKSEVDEFFENDTVEVVLDQNISAKALAGDRKSVV